MASWGSTVRAARMRLRQLDATVAELQQLLAATEEVVEAAQLEAHFRIDALEAAA